MRLPVRSCEPSGRCPEYFAEMPGEVRLVVEAGFHGDRGRRCAVEQQSSREVDSPAGHIAVWRCSELCREGAREVTGVGTQEPAGLSECDAVDKTSLEQIAQTSGDGAVGRVAKVLADVGREAGCEREEYRFCREFLAGGCQRSVRAAGRGDEIDATGLIHDAAGASLRHP